MSASWDRFNDPQGLDAIEKTITKFRRRLELKMADLEDTLDDWAGNEAEAWATKLFREMALAAVVLDGRPIMESFAHEGPPYLKQIPLSHAFHDIMQAAAEGDIEDAKITRDELREIADAIDAAIARGVAAEERRKRPASE